MKYIAVSGAMYSGKSTVTQRLVHTLPDAVSFETGEVISKVADLMNKDLEEISRDLRNPYELLDWINYLPVALEEVTTKEIDPQTVRLRQGSDVTRLREYTSRLVENPKIADFHITPENKETYRPFLQWIGAFVAKQVDAGFWFEELIRRSELAAEDGKRYSVLNAVRFPGEEPVLRQVGAHIVKIIRPSLIQSDKYEATEREASQVHEDTVIYNNGTLRELEAVAETFAIDFIHGIHGHTYSAANT